MNIDKTQSYTLRQLRTGSSVKDSTRNTAALTSLSFTGGFVDRYLPLTISETEKLFLRYFPKAQRITYEWMNRLGDFAKGEAAGIGITAIGTGLVAPWPIAFNPVVDYNLKKRNATPEQIEDKHNTQKYSAWRQPISAVLALIFQLGVQKPVEKILQAITNDEDTLFKGTVFDQSFLNSGKYAENKIKQEFKSGALKIEDIQVPYFEHDEAGNLIKKTRPAESLKEAISIVKKERLNNQIAELASVIKGIKDTDTEVVINGHPIRTRFLSESLNYQIEAYINQAETLKVPSLRIAKYLKRGQELVENEPTLRALLSPENIEAKVAELTAENPKLTRPQAIREFLTRERQLYENKNQGMLDIIDHILRKKDGVIESSCARNLERIEKVKKACGGTFSMDAYDAYLTARNSKIDEKIARLKELIIPKSEWLTIKPSEIKARLKEIAAACHYDIKDSVAGQVFKDKGVFLSNKEKLEKIIFEDIIKKGYQKVVENQYKIFSQITKASVATFIMLPITCTALNKVYPVFMDIVFPKLAGKKKDDASPKVENNDKNGGVQ